MARPELGDQLGHPRVALSEPLPAELEWRPIFEQQALGAAADPVAGLEHDDVGARLGQRAGGGEAGQPRADDQDVHAPQRVSRRTASATLRAEPGVVSSPGGGERRTLCTMAAVTEGHLSSGVPYLRLGHGPPLVVASGLTTEHANPTGVRRRMTLAWAAPFAEHFTVYVVNRRPGLAPARRCPT